MTTETTPMNTETTQATEATETTAFEFFEFDAFEHTTITEDNFAGIFVEYFWPVIAEAEEHDLEDIVGDVAANLEKRRQQQRQYLGAKFWRCSDTRIVLVPPCGHFLLGYLEQEEGEKRKEEYEGLGWLKQLSRLSWLSTETVKSSPTAEEELEAEGMYNLSLFNRQGQMLSFYDFTEEPESDSGRGSHDD